MERDGGGWLSIGRVAGVFGLHGELKVELLTDFPERFGLLEQVYVGAAKSVYRLERTRPHKTHLLVKLEGVDTPEAAVSLAGQDLEIPRDQAVRLPAGHYFLRDLIGCVVTTADGEEVGTVTDVLRTGSNDVYVVGSGRGELLIPGTTEAIHRLDLNEKRMVVEPWVLEP